MTRPPKPAVASAASMDELAGHCFGCGPRNPEGLHLQFVIDPVNITAYADLTLTETHQGPPGFLHGGIIATLLDEAASKLNRPLGLLAMTRHMEVEYLRPAPIHTPLRVTGSHLRREGRKLFHESALATQDGTVLARGSLLFIIVPTDVLPAAVRAHIDPATDDLA